MTDADKIRDFAANMYIKPARKAKMAQVSFNAKEIHSALGFDNRYPNVCGAIDRPMFCVMNNVSLLKRVPSLKQGPDVTWTFKIDLGTPATILSNNN